MRAAPQAYRVPRARAPIDLALDANEGPPPPADLLAGLAARGAELLRRYPDASALERALAERLDLDPAQVLVTAGADDALDRACRAFLAGGGELVLPAPTFEMLERYAPAAGGALRRVDWPQGPYPVGDVLRACGPATSLVAVVSPNNPTGAVATADDLRRLARSAPQARLLVDLAYAEFADEDLTAAALALPGALVTRTFSKAWGLAGLRVGYALGGPEDIARLRAAGAPYAVGGLSLATALARLERGDEDVRAGVARVRQERGRLFDLLGELGLRPQPSQANFVLARCDDPTRLRDLLAGLGIGVRVFPGREGLEDAVRIGCPGDGRAFARLEGALRAALRPEALLLDLDGVLADVSRSYRAAIEGTARRFGVELEPGAIGAAKARGQANDDWELTRALLAERGVEVPLDEVRAAFEALYQGTPQRPGLWTTERLLVEPERLAAWARRWPLAIVTGRPRGDALRFLETQGIAGSIAALVTREEAPLKPDPGPVRLALERLGVEAAWMVGDTPDDVRAARAAGVVPVGVRPPGEVDDVLEGALLDAGAARVLRGLDELEDLLR
jgi:histidinol-phosphate aminotransferase